MQVLVLKICLKVWELDDRLREHTRKIQVKLIQTQPATITDLQSIRPSWENVHLQSVFGIRKSKGIQTGLKHKFNILQSPGVLIAY